MDPRSRILVADDDPELLATVSDALRRGGADVVSVSSGAEMIQRVADKGPFDLVVTDISMPWMSGLQVAQSARGAGLNMPIIVMTALADRELARLSGQLRALGDRVVMLRKPFGLEELDGAVARLLS
jgi:CheY-like chemotaxis protein